MNDGYDLTDLLILAVSERCREVEFVHRPSRRSFMFAAKLTLSKDLPSALTMRIRCFGVWLALVTRESFVSEVLWYSFIPFRIQRSFEFMRD